MTRIATPENEDYLMVFGLHGTASHVERLVRNYRRVRRAEGLDITPQTPIPDWHGHHPDWGMAMDPMLQLESP